MADLDLDAIAVTIWRDTDGRRVCGLPGCDSVHWCRGMCRRHHKQWARTGNPIAPGTRAGGRPPAAGVPAWLDLPRLARTTPTPGWERYGNCYEQADTDRYFPQTTAGADDKAPCTGCPARYACLAAALSRPHTNDYGIWGGTSRHERRRIRPGLNALRATRSAA